MEEPDIEKRWFDYADTLIDTALAIFEESQIPIGEKGAADPKVLAVILLARTVSNFRGMISLLRQGLVVEARILTRSCYENQFWIGGLATRGDAFVQDMYDDERKSRAGRAEWILAQKALGAEAEARLRGQLKQLKGPARPAKYLAPKTVAQSGPLEKAYLIYSQLSADAAHPSVSSLGRYMVRIQDDGKMVRAIQLAPEPQPGEVGTTLDWGCGAMLGVCVGVNQILEGTPAGKRLWNLADKYQELTQRDGGHLDKKQDEGKGA